MIWFWIKTLSGGLLKLQGVNFKHASLTFLLVVYSRFLKEANKEIHCGHVVVKRNRLIEIAKGYVSHECFLWEQFFFFNRESDENPLLFVETYNFSLHILKLIKPPAVKKIINFFCCVFSCFTATNLYWLTKDFTTLMVK